MQAKTLKSLRSDSTVDEARTCLKVGLCQICKVNHILSPTAEKFPVGVVIEKKFQNISGLRYFWAFSRSRCRKSGPSVGFGIRCVSFLNIPHRTSHTSQVPLRYRIGLEPSLDGACGVKSARYRASQADTNHIISETITIHGIHLLGSRRRAQLVERPWVVTALD